MLCGCSGWLLAACSDTPEHGDGAPPSISSTLGTDAGDGGVDAGTTPALAFDASLPPQAVSVPQPRCRPGSYTGKFDCLISGLLPWGGTMAFSLVQEASWTGGEFETLQILPGTRITGTDETFAGTFSANMHGKFSCQTGILMGSLDDGTYLIMGSTPIMMAGSLEGRYLADAAAPSFEGSMGPLRTPDLDILGTLAPMAMCTWKASRTGDVDYDAGVDASR